MSFKTRVRGPGAKSRSRGDRKGTGAKVENLAKVRSTESPTFGARMIAESEAGGRQELWEEPLQRVVLCLGKV